jgi:uncharacterized protein (DUF736 family)
MGLRQPPSWLQQGSHPAENDRLTWGLIFQTSGIVKVSDFATTQQSTPNMSVQCAAGGAAILGTYQSNMGAYLVVNDAALTATITTAHATLPRIDLVCLTINDAAYTGVLNSVVLQVIAGVPNASPVAPNAPTNSLAIAQVLVGAAVTSIVNANITDVRVRTTTPFGSFTPNVVTTNQNITAGNEYMVTTSSSLTLTMPAAASAGDEMHLYDATGTAATYNIVCNSNGLKINGVVQNLLIDKNFGRAWLKYINSTYGWEVM